MASRYAAKSGRISVPKWLLKRGAGVYVRDGNGCAALEVAEFVRHVKVAGVWREQYENEREPLWSVFMQTVSGVIEMGG